MENYDKGAAKKISAVFSSRQPFDCQRVLWNRSFRAFEEPHFSESVTSQLFKL